MSLHVRPRLVPQCSACLRSYAFGLLSIMRSSGLQQQVRGKKRMPNNSGTMIVRLEKNVEGYGRKGALVPISPGAMRNQWYPRGKASYVTGPELKRLRLTNAPMTRDFQFGMPNPAEQQDANAEWMKDIPGDIKGMSNANLRNASALEKAKIEKGIVDGGSSGLGKAVEVEKLTPERSMELVELFVPQRLEFYRQPIIEEKEPEKPAPERPQYGGAAGDLLAARTPLPPKAKDKPQAIYGSVSAHDVLVAMRAVMADNDEAARVVLQEGDIQLVDLQAEGSEAGRLKHIGDFVVEIKVRGVEKAIERTVRVIPQDTQDV